MANPPISRRAPVLAKELPMIMNRIVKWAAVGVLALATVPTVGMGRTRASLPSAPVTQTPASPVGIKSTKKVSSKHVTRHKHAVKASKKASAKKHVRKTSHKKLSHKTSKKHTSHKKSAK
jgi:hypothetical protein